MFKHAVDFTPAAFLLSLLAIPLTVTADDRPNIVVLFADDISARELPIYGSSQWTQPLKGNTSDLQYKAATPNLDRLAKEGCWIKTAWASVVCSPSRAMMMTGRFAHLHKWWGNKSKGKYVDETGKQATWPLYRSSPKQIGHVAQAAGYRTYWAGKTQMAGDLNRFGFDQGCFTPGSMPDQQNRLTDFKLINQKVDGKKQLVNADTMQPVDSYAQQGWYWHPHVSLMNHDGRDFQWWPNTKTSKEAFGLSTYGPDVEIDFIFDFMESQVANKQPFFVYHTSHLGHDGFDWLHPNSKSKWPGTPRINWDGKKYTRIQPHITGDNGQFDTHDTVTSPGIHHHINYLDYQVWMYQEKFKQLGILENTIFIFCSDNGTLGYGKNSTDRQTGTHVPMIISAPGLTKRGEQDVLVSLADLLPTIAEVTGVKLPANYEINGKSLVPFLFGEQSDHRDWLYGYKDNEQIIRGKNVLRDGRGKWWNVANTPDDLISFPQIKNWQTVSAAHRTERDKLLTILPRFEQQAHGKNAYETGTPAGENQPPVGDTAPPAWKVIWKDKFDGVNDVDQRYYIPSDHTGAWTVEEGHLVGNQVKSNHGSVIRAEVDFADVDIQFDFRFRGGSRFNFVIDDKQEKSVHAGHICRASVSPKQVSIGDDKEGAMNLQVRAQREANDLSPQEAKTLAERLARTKSSVSAEIGVNNWHTLRLRIRGDMMKAFLDGELVTSLRSPGFAHPTKDRCGFTVNGKSIDFDNLIIRTPQNSSPIDRHPTQKKATPKDAKPIVDLTKVSSPVLSNTSNSPNILWVVTDDQRADSIAAFNRIFRDNSQSELGYVASPNVDRLARMGTTFINTFNQNPGCAPSRTLMHTGRYSHRTGVYGFEYYNATGHDHWRPMFPEILRDKAGYQTMAVGKLGIRAQHFTKPPQPGPRLYQTFLGYRKEFSSQSKVDWNSDKRWSGGKPGPKEEVFIFPDGEQLYWPEDRNFQPNNRAEIQKRLGLLRQYTPNQKHDDSTAHTGSILGGVNPTTGDKTRDGNFTTALLNHLANADQSYTDLLGREQKGPNSGKPLMAYIGYEFPHTPVLPPQEFRNQFIARKYKIPQLTEAELTTFSPQMQKLYANSQTDHFTDAQKQQMIADYYAFCAYGDSLVGTAVDGFIQYSETKSRPWLVLYVCGDHGWRLNEHGMVSKFAHYDIDLHNPLIVVSSDKTAFPAGKVVEDFTEFVDIAPTLLASAGIDVSKPEYAYLDGRDLAKTAAGEFRPRDYVIAEPTWVTGPRAVIRTKDYKFAMKTRPRNGHSINKDNAGQDIQWALTAELSDIEPALFDLRSDPKEIHNLAFDPNYRPVLDTLRTKLQNIVLGDGRVEVAWTKQGKDEVHISNFSAGADDDKIEVPKLLITN